MSLMLQLLQSRYAAKAAHPALRAVQSTCSVLVIVSNMQLNLFYTV